MAETRISRVLAGLSVGLGVLWLLGITLDTGANNHLATLWIAWLDLIMAITTFRLARGVSRYNFDRGSLMISALSTSSLLFIFWLGSLWNIVTPLLTWMNLLFMVAFLSIGIYYGGKIPGERARHMDELKHHPDRKSDEVA